MDDARTFKEWMEYYGYHWNDGQEQLYKGLMDKGHAQDLIARLETIGAIIDG